MGMGELLVVLLVVVIFFGGAKLPQLGEGLGKAIRNFKDAASGKGEARKDADPKPPQNPNP